MKNLRKIASVFILASLVMTGCQKENVKELIQAQNNAETAPFLQEISDLADAEYLSVEVEGGDEYLEFGSPDEGLIEEYLLEDDSYDNLNKSGGARLIRCLKSVHPGDDQIPQIRKALVLFKDCKATSVKKHRMAYRQLRAKIEGARKNLIHQYRLGKITQKEFKAEMHKLRMVYHTQMKHLKESYSKTLKECYGGFLKHLNRILTDRQWDAFAKCLKFRQ